MLVKVNRSMTEKDIEMTVQQAKHVASVYERGDMVEERVETSSYLEALQRFLGQIGVDSHYYITVPSGKLGTIHKYL